MKAAGFVLLMMLVAAGMLGATDYACAGGGNRSWHTSSDWMPTGIPGVGDTVTIRSGCNMQCEAGSACSLGKASAGNGSVDLQINLGGTLSVQPASTFDMRGDVSLLGELDIFGGLFTLNAGAATNKNGAYYIDGGSAAGPHTLKICSEASCSSNSGSLGVLDCNTSNGGTCQLRHTSSAGNSINVLGSHGRISNFGGPNLPAISLVDGTVPATGGFVLTNNFSLHSNGVVRIQYDSATLNLTFDGVAFDTLVDVGGSSSGYSFLDLISLAEPSGGDRTFRVTCANTGPRVANLFLNVKSAQFGDPEHPGMVTYNCDLLKAGRGGTYQNVLSVIDRHNGSAAALVPAKNSDAIFQDWVLLNHSNNQHHISGMEFDAGGSRNTYKGIIFDGDGYVSYDAGDDYQDTGVYSASGGLHINSSGTLFTLGAYTGQNITVDHETMYNSFGGSICETKCANTMLAQISNSLFVLPSTVGSMGGETGGNDGAHLNAAFNYNYRQLSASSNTDFNFFWQMPGSNDPGANPAKNVYIQLNLGNTPSWVELPPQETSMAWHQLPTISNSNVTCAGCFANARPNDYVVDVTARPATYAVIGSVSDSSHAVLQTSLPGYQPGHLIDVRPNYFLNAGMYGTDWGSNDQHVNPWFQDTNRTVCTWWKRQSGSPANCNWPNGNYYTADSGTSSTKIQDSAVDFDAMGVRDGLDVVLVYGPGFGAPKGAATVQQHTSNTLTIAPAISGAGQGDHFTFITAAQSMGQSVVQLYGFDVNGNQVSPPDWVTPAIAQNIKGYLQQGYTPTNLAVFGAGSDGKSVGAVQPLPAGGAIWIMSN